jgi:hypothetical protein
MQSALMASSLPSIWIEFMRFTTTLFPTFTVSTSFSQDRFTSAFAEFKYLPSHHSPPGFK